MLKVLNFCTERVEISFICMCIDESQEKTNFKVGGIVVGIVFKKRPKAAETMD